jgi:alginate O-acetyltransferase complex protein AlgI
MVFLVYWFVLHKSLSKQNLFLFAASYFFYACWDIRFLGLLFFSTFLDYFTGLKIYKSPTQNAKKGWLVISLVLNLGFLAFFKYFNFFAQSLADLLALFNIKNTTFLLQVVLPVGISFYTFHGVSYVLDIYNKKITPEKNFTTYALFVSFFPLLVAGPIERATHLLPQLKTARQFNYTKATDGLRQILWGLFKKVVIADNCAVYANEIFGNYTELNGSTLLLGAVFFAFQIYGDFSGYSDMALGIARLFGIELLQNFSFPYFSRDMSEFWRRWHISLSSWFRDYLYIPLGGNRKGQFRAAINLVIVFLVSGFWHGANYTFIVWGLANALLVLPVVVFKLNKNATSVVAANKFLPSVPETLQILFTFLCTCLIWVFFRSDNVTMAFTYLKNICNSSFFTPFILQKATYAYFTLILIAFFVGVEWLGRRNKYAIETLGLKWPKYLRFGFYYLLIAALFICSGDAQQFIYFQF